VVVTGKVAMEAAVYAAWVPDNGCFPKKKKQIMGTTKDSFTYEKFYKNFQITRLIKSCDTCMEH